MLAGYLLINLVFGNILSRASWGVGWGFPHWWYFCRYFLGMVVRTGGYAAFRAVDNIVKIALEQTAGGQSIAVLLRISIKSDGLRRGRQGYRAFRMHPRWLWRHQTACGCFP